MHHISKMLRFRDTERSMVPSTASRTSAREESSAAYDARCPQQRGQLLPGTGLGRCLLLCCLSQLPRSAAADHNTSKFASLAPVNEFME